MKLEIKEEGEMDLAIKDNNRAIRKNTKKWVSVESLIEYLDELIKAIRLKRTNKSGLGIIEARAKEIRRLLNEN